MRPLIGAVALTLLAATTPQSCDSPASKGPTQPVTELVIMVESNPSNIYANIVINAHDHGGLPSVNLESGEVYPTSYARRTPYRHVIVHPASATVTYIVDATIGGEPGDLLTCSMLLNGRQVEVHVTEVPGDLHSAKVYCEYTYYPTT